MGVGTSRVLTPFLFALNWSCSMEDRELSEREAAARGLPARMRLHPFEAIAWFEGATDGAESESSQNEPAEGREDGLVEIPG
jgi:hypothetical protein